MVSYIYIRWTQFGNHMHTRRDPRSKMIPRTQRWHAMRIQRAPEKIKKYAWQQHTCAMLMHMCTRTHDEERAKSCSRARGVTQICTQSRARLRACIAYTSDDVCAWYVSLCGVLCTTLSSVTVSSAFWVNRLLIVPHDGTVQGCDARVFGRFALPNKFY